MQIKLKHTPNAIERCLLLVANGIIYLLTAPIQIVCGIALLPVCLVVEIADAIRKR